MTDAQALARLTSTLHYLDLAFMQLEGVDGMEHTQEQIAGLLMDVEEQLNEFISIG